jgi:hypothetical protein
MKERDNGCWETLVLSHRDCGDAQDEAKGPFFEKNWAQLI